MKHYQLYINGEFVQGRADQAVLNPATGEILSYVPKATLSQVNDALCAAKEAQLKWELLPAVERGVYLHKIATKIREKAEFLAQIITKEQGKLIDLARVEVNFTADYLDYMAEWARRYEGEIVPSDRPHEMIFIHKLPIGVIAGILPWNFPFFLIARKAGPALLTGNTIVIKPSEETPNNAFEFAKIVDEVGVPKGVFNLISGDGPVVGNALASSPLVGMVSLTGSVEAGVKVMQAAAKNITKVNLELGGKAPALVYKDANVDKAVEHIKNSRIINNGQVCNCAERIYIHRSRYAEFAEKMTAAMKNTILGNPLDNNVDMGPLINQAGVDKVQQLVDSAVQSGATVLTGGSTASQGNLFYQATVLVDCKQEMDIIKQEIFGPVLPLVPFDDLDEAIALANDSEYGLTSSIYTQNLDVAMRASREIKCGETYINRENFEAMQGYHAGWRKSGIGGADGKHGLEEYLQTKVVYLQYDHSVK